MMKGYLGIYSLLVFVLITCTFMTLARQKNLQNTVIIPKDDLLYPDAETFGAPAYKTFNIDMRPGQGSRFTNFFSSQPVCTLSGEDMFVEGATIPKDLGVTLTKRKGENRGETETPEVIKLF